jgi:hypothetical protein
MKESNYVPAEIIKSDPHLLVPGDHETWDTLKIYYNKVTKIYRIVAFVDGAGQSWQISESDLKKLLD